jgi:iron complex outermembrane receptor protein
MFKFMIMAAIVLSSSHVLAQNLSITGIVKEGKNNQPLAGATVLAENPVFGQTVLSRIAVTDPFGRFRIEKLPAGEYVLRVRYVGYEEKSEALSLSQSTEVTMVMAESVQITDEVIVYATRANEKTPTTFTNVGAQALSKQNFGQDMPFLLNWTPSLVTTSDAGAGIGYTGLRIRGSDATRINVTINGVSYNDSESQGTFWVNIPDIGSSTSSVQIQRGVGTSTNGAGAFGGSVNVQTISQQREAYADLIAAAGSFNTQRYTMRAGTGLIKGKWTFDGRVSNIRSDGYIDRASSELNSYYLSGGYYGKKTIIKAIAFGGEEKTYQSWNGIDEEMIKTDRTFNSAGALYDENYNVTGYYDNEVDHYRQDHYQLHLTEQLNENWNANVSLHYTYGRGYYEQYKQLKPFAELGLEDIVLKDTTLTAGDFIIRKWLDNDFYGTTFSLNYEKEKLSFSLGGAYNEYANARHFGEIIWSQYASNSSIRQHYYEGESQKNDFNIYTKWNYKIAPALDAFVDLQYRHVDYVTAGTDDDLNDYSIEDGFNFFNPKAGVSYSLSARDMLYGSYAVANREPNRTDYMGGSTKPKPERLDNIEIGWRKNSANYSFELNYYLMNYTDQLVLTGRLDNVGSPVRANVGKSYRTGIELSGAIRISDQLMWNANVTWSSNKNRDYVIDEADLTKKKNTSIILSPDWIGGSQLEWKAFPQFQAYLMSKYVGKQYLDNTENDHLTLDPYFINDLRLTYSLTPKGMTSLDLSVLMNNIFDVAYSSNGATYGDGVAYYFPQAGRSLMGMVTVKF